MTLKGDKMKALVIGTGSVARANYLPVLAAQEDIQLLYYNRTRSRASECSRLFGGTVYDSIEAAMEHTPDLIFVLTSETARAEILRKMCRHKPQRLFLEKPLVAEAGQDHVSEDDFFIARELMTEVSAANCETAMIFNYRFFEQSQRAHRIIRTRSFGAVLNVTASTNYACWSHVIDLMHFFVGPIEQVSASAGRHIHSHGPGAAADIVAALGFENGACGTLLGSWSLDFGFPLFDFSVNCEGGRVHMSGLDGELEVFDYGNGCRETYSITHNSSRWDWYKASFEKSITAYLKSIRTANPPPVPGKSGLEELQVEAALRRSIREGRPVILEKEFPLVP